MNADNQDIRIFSTLLYAFSEGIYKSAQDVNHFDMPEPKAGHMPHKSEILSLLHNNVRVLLDSLYEQAYCLSMLSNYNLDTEDDRNGLLRYITQIALTSTHIWADQVTDKKADVDDLPF